jgi:hypothetical protein
MILLKNVAHQLTAKYGKEFAQSCRTNDLNNVNEKVMHKLGVRTLGTIGREYTKETVQYTDSKEIKTMFHSMLCRFLSAFLKIY